MTNTWLLLGILFLSNVSFGDTVHNPELWARIDSLNLELRRTNKPLPLAALERLLGQAMEISTSKEMDKDYQTVRAAAFKVDFSEADGLSQRAKPAFVFVYGGDYDVHAVDFSHFRSRALPGTPEARFFNAYLSYSYSQASVDGGALPDCRSPFYISNVGDPKILDSARLKEQFQAIAKQLKKGLLHDISVRTLRCLKGKRP